MSETAGRLLIVGAGQAGLQLAANARELGWSGPITLAGAEPHPPYERPPLSKAVLRGSAGMDSLVLRSTGFYTDKRLTLALGERIERLTLDGGGAGGTATAASGGCFAFDRLALATGARPRALPVRGAALDGVVMLRDLADAENLGRRLAAASDLVVIGGGLIGLEVAAVAAAAGVRATVIEAAPTLMNRMVSPAAAKVIAEAHRSAGVQILLGARPSRFVGADPRTDGHGPVTAVELADGTRIPAQVVLVAVGATPREDLARAAGLHCDNGIVVDEFSLASDGRTIAVGDCANLPDPSPQPGPARLRLESVDNAVTQAAAAAATLMGRSTPYRSVPWFWSEQGGLKLHIAGLARAGDGTVARPGTRPGQHTFLRYRGDRLVAAECVNSPADFAAVRKALAAGADLPREAAADTSVTLRQHFAAVAPRALPVAGAFPSRASSGCPAAEFVK
ncbi:ferredoxin [Trebonia kvetii]|uniref:Ferredoxin n=1 Tax=Trebonia kvetii TaxID=2480626 RepID=A0A6P2BSY4_9ACTN|nr:FAD-dependent oxidoreductase [Trebonia kvetii]TVZ02209.1 ferredoxin [Trebonia kvetii]